MGTLRKVKGVHPLMDKGFGLLWYICMGGSSDITGFTGTLPALGNIPEGNFFV